MKNILNFGLAIALLASVAQRTNADVTVDTLPANNQANLFVDCGQTFTTGVLTDTQLDTIEIEGPQADDGEFLGPFVLELYTDGDGDHSTWDPGVLLASSDAQSFVSGDATITTFTFASLPELNSNTVYAFTYTDDLGVQIGARMGLTNATAIADGTLFSQGTAPFGDAFDTAMRITTTTSKDCLLGDVNMDGSVDLLDVTPFVDAITSGLFQCEADVNQDGNVDLLDVGPFVDLLAGP